jgi:hypothetical protein
MSSSSPYSLEPRVSGWLGIASVLWIASRSLLNQHVLWIGGVAEVEQQCQIVDEGSQKPKIWGRARRTDIVKTRGVGGSFGVTRSGRPFSGQSGSMTSGIHMEGTVDKAERTEVQIDVWLRLFYDELASAIIFQSQWPMGSFEMDPRKDRSGSTKTIRIIWYDFGQKQSLIGH